MGEPPYNCRHLLCNSCPVKLFGLFSVATAIEAMRNANRSELERELEKARKSNHHVENADMGEIRRQHE